MCVPCVPEDNMLHTRRAMMVAWRFSDLRVKASMHAQQKKITSIVSMLHIDGWMCSSSSSFASICSCSMTFKWSWGTRNSLFHPTNTSLPLFKFTWILFCSS